MNAETITIGTSDREASASAIVRSYMGWSTGAGLLPIPLLDLALIVGVQVKMLHDMAKLYGVPFRANMVRPLIVALVSGGTFLDFDAAKVRAHYEQQFNAAKAV